MSSKKKIVDLRGKQPLFKLQPKQGGGLQKRVPLRARRRRARSIAFISFLVFLALVIVSVHFLSYVPQYSINTVNVVGAEIENPERVREYVDHLMHDGSNHFFSPANIFAYPREAIEQGLTADFPHIASVKTSRSSLFSQTLDVQVTERQPFALWCNTVHDCYEMDDSGYIFTRGALASSTMYIFQGGFASTSDQTTYVGQGYVPAHLPGIIAVLEHLSQAGVTPRGATVHSDDDFSVPLTEGFTIKASFGESADQLSKNLRLVLSSEPLQGKIEELEYIDLRFGNRVYYKFKGQEQVNTQ